MLNGAAGVLVALKGCERRKGCGRVDLGTLAAHHLLRQRNCTRSCYFRCRTRCWKGHREQGLRDSCCIPGANNNGTFSDEQA